MNDILYIWWLHYKLSYWSAPLNSETELSFIRRYTATSHPGTEWKKGDACSFTRNYPQDHEHVSQARHKSLYLDKNNIKDQGGSLEKGEEKGLRKNADAQTDSGAPVWNHKESNESSIRSYEGTEKCQDEFGIGVIAYNMKRAIKIRGVKPLLSPL